MNKREKCPECEEMLNIGECVDEHCCHYIEGRKRVDLPVSFETELEHLINKYSKENDSNTPDFILAEYLKGCLDVFNNIVPKRDKWYGVQATGVGLEPLPEKCEGGCEAPVAGYDSEGIPLCQECLDELRKESASGTVEADKCAVHNPEGTEE